MLRPGIPEASRLLCVLREAQSLAQTSTDRRPSLLAGAPPGRPGAEIECVRRSVHVRSYCLVGRGTNDGSVARVAVWPTSGCPDPFTGTRDSALAVARDHLARTTAARSGGRIAAATPV